MPRGGDNFQILPGSNTAGQIKFLLTRPHDLAAASPDLITASNSNVSDAELSMRRISPSIYPENGVITGDLPNSLSAVEAQEFIKDGLITSIPAGTDRVDIASFTKQASAKFIFTGLGLQNINQFFLPELTPMMMVLILSASGTQVLIQAISPAIIGKTRQTLPMH